MFAEQALACEHGWSTDRLDRIEPVPTSLPLWLVQALEREAGLTREEIAELDAETGSVTAQRGEIASASVTDRLGCAPDGPESGAGHRRNQVCGQSELCALGSTADRAHN